jgi:FSR family fosmidomycin resistance protein-like MFS transporter
VFGQRLRHAGLLASMGTVGVRSTLLGVAPELWVVFLLIVAGGLGSAAFHPAAVVLARRVLPDRAQLAVSLFAAGGMIGMAFGPLAVLLIAAHAGLGFTPLLMIPGVILGDILWRFLPPEPRAPRAVDVGQARELLRGPVGRLALAAGLMSLALTTFGAGLPMWLTEEGGYADDAAPIGIMLALFQIGAAVGGLTIGWAASRVLPARLAAITMLLAAPTLLLVLAVEPGSVAFYSSVLVAGLLGSAATPLLIVGAQERAPHAVAAASGMVMGLANGAAGLAFIGVGALADAAGLRIGLTVGFLAAVPAAVIARHALASLPTTEPQLLIAALCGCVACGCAVADTRCDDNCARTTHKEHQ